MSLYFYIWLITMLVWIWALVRNEQIKRKKCRVRELDALAQIARLEQDHIVDLNNIGDLQADLNQHRKMLDAEIEKNWILRNEIKCRRMNKGHKRNRREEFLAALTACEEAPSIQCLAEYLGVSQRTIKARMKEGGYHSVSGIIVKNGGEV